MAFSAEESKLVSIFIQTLLYGAYIVLFTITCWVLIRRRPRGQSVHKTMLGIAVTMFILATMIFGSTIYVAQTLLGDSVVLLRCYLVWGSRLAVVAFPFLLLLGSTVTGIGILYSFARVVPQAEIFVVELSQWIVAFFSMTLATNIICTGTPPASFPGSLAIPKLATALVAYRIWSINRTSISFSEHSLRPIMLLVIESGAIYSATLTALLILYKTESWFQYVLLDAVSPIVVRLVFSMVIVRIGLGITTTTGETGDFGGVSTLQASGEFSGNAKNFGSIGKTERVELTSFTAAPSNRLTYHDALTMYNNGYAAPHLQHDFDSTRYSTLDSHLFLPPNSKIIIDHTGTTVYEEEVWWSLAVLVLSVEAM
ncbi:hypothetical protein Hypma_005347 [Hypsizygus marmoreus]|uniref:Uncharacterized protein n=1 Tax=Hypsizygus marmoreus TaxID=39966 RepID=A0A369K7G8_HYPMA|nr:hypothetical protein Hypma_005347 [Hypsizygus marmoreus]